jgi:hypothetical protein
MDLVLPVIVDFRSGIALIHLQKGMDQNIENLLRQHWYQLDMSIHYQ